MVNRLKAEEWWLQGSNSDSYSATLLPFKGSTVVVDMTLYACLCPETLKVECFLPYLARQEGAVMTPAIVADLGAVLAKLKLPDDWKQQVAAHQDRINLEHSLTKLEEDLLASARQDMKRLNLPLAVIGFGLKGSKRIALMRTHTALRCDRAFDLFQKSFL